MQVRRRTPRRAVKRDSLERRLLLCLLLSAALWALRAWQPDVLDPIRTVFFANTGAVAEAFAAFTDSVGTGGDFRAAWSELQSELLHDAAA